MYNNRVCKESITIWVDIEDCDQQQRVLNDLTQQLLPLLQLPDEVCVELTAETPTFSSSSNGHRYVQISNKSVKLNFTHTEVAYSLGKKDIYPALITLLMTRINALFTETPDGVPEERKKFHTLTLEYNFQKPHFVVNSKPLIMRHKEKFLLELMMNEYDHTYSRDKARELMTHFLSEYGLPADEENCKRLLDETIYAVNKHLSRVKANLEIKYDKTAKVIRLEVVK